MINGHTTLIAHLGFPTDSFKSSMVYNPWFAQQGINAVVVPMGVEPVHFAALVRSLFALTNLRGALVSMPHKVAALALVNDATPAARVAGACNAIVRGPDGRLLGDQFDGVGFVRAAQRKGCHLLGARVLVVGAGGVGSAIAGAMAAAGVGALMLFDTRADAALALALRLRAHFPNLEVGTGSRDPAGFDIVVNATPMGMQPQDPLPFDAERLAPSTHVGEVVVQSEYTPLLRAAIARGCSVQLGTDMLFEMIPAYLECFGYGSPTPEALRAVSRIDYAEC